MIKKDLKDYFHSNIPAIFRSRLTEESLNNNNKINPWSSIRNFNLIHEFQTQGDGGIHKGQ